MNPEEIRKTRELKKTEEEKERKTLERRVKMNKFISSIDKPLKTVEEYIKAFKKEEFENEEWETILVDISTLIYSVRKPFGIMGKKQCEEFKESIAKSHGHTVFLIEAVFDFFKFSEFKEVMGDILIEALKYPLDDAKKSAEGYLKEKINRGEITPLFWRKLLLKRYVSGETWKILVQYFPIAEEKNCVSTIRQAIEDHMNNRDLTKKERDQMAENWGMLEKTPLDVYQVNYKLD